MSLLNLGLLNLALTIYGDAPDWLIYLLHDVSTMKSVQDEIELYDKEVMKDTK